MIQWNVKEFKICHWINFNRVSSGVNLQNFLLSTCFAISQWKMVICCCRSIQIKSSWMLCVCTKCTPLSRLMAIDWLVSKSAGVAHFGSHFDTMRNDSRFRCRYKSLQSRFITENILQFNSIKTISILDLFMLPIHSYHLARYICFNWCSVTVQWSWNGNNTQSQFILHFVYAHNGTRHGKEAATPKRTITKKSIAHAHAQT